MKIFSWIGFVLIFWNVQENKLFADEINKTSAFETFIHKNSIPQDALLGNIESQLKNHRFPYQEIYQYVPISDIHLQYKVLEILQDHYQEKSVVQELFFQTMTDSLLNFLEKSIDFENIHELSALTSEVYTFYIISTLKDENHLLYNALLDFWMQWIQAQVSTIEKNDERVKYTFEYQYIQKICEHTHYFSTSKLSNTEKVIDNIAQNKWTYLFERFLLRTTFLQKTIFFLISIIVVFSVLYTSIHLIKRKK